MIKSRVYTRVLLKRKKIVLQIKIAKEGGKCTVDFIGFTYNGKHSFHDLGIYRTSNGSRYDENLTPSLTDKTADATGRDGQYYFYTTAKNKTFTVQYAFDSLTEKGLRQLKNTFDGRAIHDLIFDESPYKTWSAKVTGNSQIKHLCFTDENGQRVYKGEGSLTFTCYWPYARTTDLTKEASIETKATLPARVKIQCNLFTQGGEEYKLVNELGVEITIEYAQQINGVWGSVVAEKLAAGAEKVFNNPVWIKTLVATKSANEEKYLILADEDYYYTSNKTFEFFGEKDGRNINHYSSTIYPNKIEWATDAGLLATPKHGENYGDMPATFVYKNEQVSAETEISLGNIGKITIHEDCTNLRWDSKIGLITGDVQVIAEDTSGNAGITTINRPIYYSGDSLVTIPIGKENNITLSEKEELEYNYWYY